MTKCSRCQSWYQCRTQWGRVQSHYQDQSVSPCPRRSHYRITSKQPDPTTINNGRSSTTRGPTLLVVTSRFSSRRSRSSKDDRIVRSYQRRGNSHDGSRRWLPLTINNSTINSRRGPSIEVSRFCNSRHPSRRSRDLYSLASAVRCLVISSRASALIYVKRVLCR